MTTQTRHMRLATCMALFQNWRAVSGRKTHDNGPTLSMAKEQLIERRIHKMRPEYSWPEIADSLGVAKKTLWTYRNKYEIDTP